jgi:hypothetical protein
MIYGPDGAEVRSGHSDRAIRADHQEGQEAALREKLKSIDELLDIVYIEWAGRYSLICNWPQGDARWEMYQRGEIGAHHDALGWFCVDMQDPTSLPTSLDDIENKVLELLASCDNNRQDWKFRMQDHIEHNKKVRKDRHQIALEQVQDVAETLWNAVGKHDNHHVEKLLEEVSRGRT